MSLYIVFDSISVSIKRENIDHAIRTIGVRVNPLGTNKTEFEYRLKYTKEWTNMIQNSYLHPSEVQRAFRTVYIPSITYPMSAVYFTPSQCHKLQNTAAKAYLPKLGFNRKLPKQILYGPTHLGGLGEKELYAQVAILQTKTFLGHIRNRDETGSMLLSELEYTQQISGLGQPILDEHTTLTFLKLTPSSWITNFKQTLQNFNGHVTLTNSWLPTTQCKHDVFLMEYFSSHIDEKDTLRLLNNCRLYLQIFTLADITSTNGKTITKYSLAGIRNPSYQTTLHWPKQT